MQTHLILWHFMVICVVYSCIWCVCVCQLNTQYRWRIWKQIFQLANVQYGNDTGPKTLLCTAENEHRFMLYDVSVAVFRPVMGLSFSLLCMSASNDVLRLMLMFMHTHHRQTYSFFFQYFVIIKSKSPLFFEVAKTVLINSQSGSQRVFLKISLHLHCGFVYFYFKAATNACVGLILLTNVRFAVLILSPVHTVCISTSDLSIFILLRWVYNFEQPSVRLCAVHMCWICVF